MTEQSSPTSQTASAFYDPDSSCWRMCQASFQLDLDEEADWTLLQRLPDWGTTAAGALCEQATPEHLTGVRAGSALLGTPTTATSGRSPEHGRGRAPNPQELAALLPTPTVNNAKESGTQRDWGGDLTAALLPTPTARDYKDQGENVDLTRSATKGHLSGLPLMLLPTPTTVDAKVFGPNVDWQLRLSNHAPHTASVLMNLPSNDGNGSSDDQHPPQPIAEDSDPSLSSG